MTFVTPRVRRQLPYWTVLASSALICALMSLFTPFQLDDYQFIGAWRESSGGSDVFSWSSWAGFMEIIRNNDNMRLSNVLSPISTMFSPWRELFPWLSGLLYASIVAMVMKLGGVTRQRGFWAAVSWAAMILFLPWRNQLFVRDYLLNYLWSGTVTLLAVILALRTLERRGFLLALVMVIIAGWWHEGFAIPVVAGMAVVTLKRRLNTGWRWWIVMTVYGVVGVSVFVCPGMLSRIPMEVTTDPALSMVLRRLIGLSLVGLAVCAALICIIIRHRPLFSSPTFVVIFTAMIISSIISLCVRPSDRTTFFPELCAIVIMLIIFSPLHFSHQRTATVGIIIWMICMAQGVWAVIWQHRLLEDNDKIMALFDGNAKTVFYDAIQPEDVPFTTLKFPVRTCWVEPFAYEALDNFLDGDGAVVVPTVLREASDSISVRLEGNLGVRRIGNALWTTPDVAEIPGVSVTMSDGSIRQTGSVALPFVTERGDSLLYLKVFNTPVSDIVAVSCL